MIPFHENRPLQGRTDALAQGPRVRGRISLLAGLLALALAGMAPLAAQTATSASSPLRSGRDAEYARGRLMIKLAPSSGAGRLLPAASSAALVEEDVLTRVRALPGVKGLRPLFSDAKTPSPGAQIQERGGKLVPMPDLTRWHCLEVDAAENILARVEELKKVPGVALAEPDYLRRPAGLPGAATDPYFAQQWHLGAAKVPEAWAYLQGQNLAPGGRRDVIVAVIDTGIDLTHPDLSANLWTNTADNSHGYNAITGSNDPTDDNGHGTHVAGIIAAQGGNQAGGVGVAYNVQLMAIKAAQYSGVLSVSDIAKGITFAVAHGADVINMSFGGYGKSTVEEDALAVAFGQAVLVAAAGNDGLPNEPSMAYPLGKPMYPASYNWVLGVMASGPNVTGDRMASFSNWDLVPNNLIEYELMAPGVGVWSTLPSGQYAAWSGTSMAAPVVSGIAALVRTKFADKLVYSSRFVMGQVAATGALQQAFTPDKGDPYFFHGVDALAALTNTPKPQLSYLQHWLFDTVTISDKNNGNGRVDAGETIDLAIAIRNQWGKADSVSVKLETSAGVVGPDPYVTMITDTVDYGAVGSFNADDNGLTTDSAGAVTGVTHPFRFSVLPTTPNGHIIPFKLTITARNGFDATDTTVYTASSSFNLTVTNGRELPRIISADTVLSKETLWIIPDATLIDAGVTVTVTEGTKIQFYSSEALGPYATQPLASLIVRGTLNVIGTQDNPVQMVLADAYSGRVIELSKNNSGIINFSYVSVENPCIVANIIDHANFISTGIFVNSDKVNGAWIQFSAKHFVDAQSITKSKFSALGSPDSSLGSQYLSQEGFRLRANGWNDITGTVQESLFANCILNLYWTGYNSAVFENNTLLNNVKLSQWSTSYVKSNLYFYTYTNNIQTLKFNHNSVLNRYLDTNPNNWSQFIYFTNGGTYDVLGQIAISGNYWGTQSDTIINASIYDGNDDFSRQVIAYKPILSIAPESTYPFVVDVSTANASGQKVSVVGAEPVTFTVTFNRDMNQTVQPQVSFGPAEPYTDYMMNPTPSTAALYTKFGVTGAWKDARTWVGTYTMNPVTGDGYQYLRVAGAQALSDPWLVTGIDSARFRFEIITSGTESMSLQANGGEGHVDLSWTQNDFDLLAGYYLYRSATADGTYTRINPTIIAPQTISFRDTTVNPGAAYFYKFTVVKTDLSESQYSNVATATPLDTVKPVILHTPVTSAQPGLPLSLTAVVTDNVAVKSATLYYRTIGISAYASRDMVKTTGDTYAVTIDGSSVVAPGVEYYLSATDGISVTQNGRPESPNQVVVLDKPVITSISPVKGPASGGTTVTLAGSNFKTGAKITFGGAAASAVTFVSSSQLTCVAPAHFAATVDVLVTNPDNQSGSLLRGFAFESDTASLSLPTQSAAQNNIIQIPLNAAVINGLAAADLTITFDPAILKPRTAVAGALTTGWTVVVNTGTSGQLKISMASPGGTVTGSGVLALLEFEVIGAPGTSSALGLTAVKLNGGAILANTAAGTLNVAVAYSVSGSARHWKNNAAVSGVLLQATGDRIYSDTTSASGTYSITALPPATYTVRPSKSTEVVGITAYDASLVLQHSAGLITLTGSAATAADVDKSGAINAMDAYYILQKAADLLTLPFPGAGVIWDFSPSTRTYTSLGANQVGQDYTGILLGDVSGNWSGQEAQTGAPVYFRMQEAAPAADGTLTALVAMNPRNQIINSLDAVLSYDPARGTPVSATLTTAASSWALGANLTKPGEIRISMASAVPVGSDSGVLALKFNLLGTSQDVTLRAKGVLVNERATANFTLDDVAIVSRFLSGAATPTAADLAKYDLAPFTEGTSAGDGKLDIEDFVLILRAALGLGL